MQTLKKAAVNTALAGVTMLAGTGAYGCAKDETPPVIQSYQDVNPPIIQNFQIPEYSVEGENVAFIANASDNKGIKEGYFQLDSGLTIPLTKDPSSTKENEVWKGGSTEIPVGSHVYELVIRDAAKNEAKKEGKITVYSKNSVYGYAWNKSIGIYLPQLLNLEKDGTLDQYDKAFIDLVAKYPKAGELVPGIYGEFLLLPDFSMEKYSRIDEKDIEATEKILKLASDPNNKEEFEQILNEGIRDKRSYAATLEALLWEAYDKDFNSLDKLFKNFSIENLIKDSWRNSTTSNNYKSERWKIYEDVITRCISPLLAKQYTSDNFKYIPDPYRHHFSKETFEAKGSNCSGVSSFMFRCLWMNGYDFDEFEKHETNAACTLSTYTFDKQAMPAEMGHTILLVKTNGQIYTIWTAPL